MTPHERFQAIGTALECPDRSCCCHEYAFKKSFKTHCPLPAHHQNGDDNPSLGLTLNEAGGTIAVRCYTGNGCTEDAVIAELRSRGLWWTAPLRTGVTVAQLAAAKNFGSEYLSTFGVRDGTGPDGLPFVQIPYADQSGTIVAVHRRHALTGGQRFSWRSGDKVLLYGLDRLPAIYRTGYVVLVEGETDCWAGWRYDLPLLGLPGKDMWKSEWADILVRDGLAVYVWVEPDAHEIAARIAKDVPGLRALIPAPGLKDLCEAYQRGDDLHQLLDGMRERAVPATDLATDSKKGAVPWEVPPSADTVDGAALIASLEGFFERYLVLPPGAALTMSAYAVMTYLVDTLDAVPYLAVTSPRPRCGKSRALQCAEQVMFHPLRTSNISESALFRTIEKKHPTVMLDEAQQLRAADERSRALHDLLCSGYQRGMRAIRVGGPNRDEILEFDVFGPKLIALIGRLTDVLMDRGIEIAMRRRTKGERVSTWSRKRANREADPLRRQLVRWAQDHRIDVGDEIEAVEQWCPEWLQDREAELWTPLLAILRLADPGRIPELEAIARQAGERKEAEGNDALSVRLLADLRAVFGSESFVSSTELVKRLLAIEDGPWHEASKGQVLTTHRLARMLREYKINPGKGGPLSQDRGYYRADFLDAWLRYLGPDPDDPDPSPTPGTGGGTPTHPVPLLSKSGLQVPKVPKSLQDKAQSKDGQVPIGTSTIARKPLQDNDFGTFGTLEPNFAKREARGMGGPPSPNGDRPPSVPLGLDLVQPAPDLDRSSWRWASTPPDAWHTRAVVIDVETRRDGTPWLVGFGTPGELPVICRWSPALATWIEAHTSGWIAYSASADRDFLQAAGIVLRGRIDDPMLKLHLVDERSWDGRENRDDTKQPVRGLKPAATFFLGMPNWESPAIQRAKTKRGLRPVWDEIHDDEMAAYCAHDVAATLALDAHAEAHFAAHPQHRRLYEALSQPLQAVLDGASGAGVPVDEPALRQWLEGFPARAAELRAEVEQLTGVDLDLNSYPQKAALLYDTLGLPVRRRTEKEKPAVDKHALAALRDQHPVVDTLLHASALASEERIYKNWLQWVRAGRLHPRFNAAGMVTGRVSSVKPTLQNVPHGAARSLITAPAGCAILVADYRTLEFGVAAWLYHEPAMLAAYRDGDVHTYTATRILGRPPAPGTDERKTFGKTPNFALLYQQSPAGFYRYGLDEMGLAWTEDQAQDVYAEWHRLYPGVREAWTRIAARQAQERTLTAPSGRTRHWARFDRRAERQGANFLVQATAAELCHCAAILAMTHSEIPSLGAELILTVHDSLVFLVPEPGVASVARLLVPVMTEHAKAYFAEQFGGDVPIPLRAELVAGPSWGEARAIEPVPVR